jgi:hypothetical protein
MTPMPVNPKVVILVNKDGFPIKIASNIAPLPELSVVTVHGELSFENEAAGMPFNQSTE